MSLKLDNNGWLNQHKVLISRIGVIIVAVIATLIAIDKTSGVLSLVANAWAGFGAAFGPLVLLSLYYRNMTANAAVTGLVMGAFTVVIWEYAGLSWQGQPLSQWVYSMVPGFLLSFASIIVVSQCSANSPIQPQKQG